MEDKPKLPDDVIKFFAEQGRVGGKTRSRNLTKKQRSEIARKASQARWNKAAQMRNKNVRQDS
jgi:hypothetical protein